MLEIALHNPRQHRQFQHDGRQLVLAQASSDPLLWTPLDSSAARGTQPTVQIVLASSGIELTNLGCKIICDDAEPCGANNTMRVKVPAQFSIGDTLFEIVDTSRSHSAARRPLETLLRDKSEFIAAESSVGGPSPATISRWFSGLGSLHRWTASLQELYVQAAQCAVEAIGLDGAMILRRRDECWEIAASHLPLPELGIHCDVAVLDELLQKPQTLFHGSAPAVEAEEGQAEFDSSVVQPTVVVSPLRNSAGNLVGAVYGFRSLHAGNARRSIRYLEANLIELLAVAVSEAIARVERESEVDRRRVLLEQAFALSPEQSARRVINEQREVTLLFADLRNFTELAASLEAEQVYELLGHVMDCLTAAVMEHDGMVIDYNGDGLAAMWNAPADQAEHSELACRAALRMLQALPDIAADWHDLLLDELCIGIGVHTGTVQVGNAGSKRRAKYGPRGPEVQLASRVECATKELGIPLLVTQSTVQRLSNRVTTRRLCRARLRGLQEAIDLYALISPAIDENLLAAWSAYDRALSLFESGGLAEAEEVLQAVDSSITAIPLQFLARHIARERGRAHRRRSTDGVVAANGPVITLSAK